MPSRRAKLALAVCLLMIAALIAVVAINARRTSPFDSELWQTTRSSRPRMVHDLLKRHHLQDKKRDEIEALLGQPDSVKAAGAQYIYWAGTDGVIDDMWLVLTFEGQQVVRVQYRPD